MQEVKIPKKLFNTTVKIILVLLVIIGIEIAVYLTLLKTII